MADKRQNRTFGVLVAVAAVLFATPALADDIADHVVFSEVLARPTDGQAVFIELYNPTGRNVSLDAYFIRSDQEDEYPALSGTIPAYGFYLVATSVEDWPAGWPAPDLVAPILKLGNESGGVALIGGGETIDMLGWGISPSYYETTPCNAPGTGRSLERKSGSSHDDNEGNGYDTNNNIFDFYARGEPEPQDTDSDVEHPPSSADDITWGFLKELYGSGSR